MMTEEKTTTETVTEEERDRMLDGVRESAHKIWLAGLGALSMAEDEGNKLFKNLIDQGEKYEAKRKEDLGKVKDEVTKVKDKATKAWSKTEEKFDDRVAKVLSGLGVPSREEINQLTDRVDRLTQSIERLIDDREKVAS